jgi:tryptophanyl-tRNA synthetase
MRNRSAGRDAAGSRIRQVGMQGDEITLLVLGPEPSSDRAEPLGRIACITLGREMSQVASAPATAQPPVRERVFSGIQPSGASHLGNYLGAQVNYVRLQDEYDAIYGIVDMHALTTVHDGATLRQLTHDMVLDLLAVGLDPERCALIRQSDFPEHTELMWIFDTVVPVSWLERTPTYKEKRDEGVANSMGLLNYPVLQAADIVIYKASRVPVGKDQAAHLELSREIARAFNRRYGEIFPEPQAVFTDAPVVLGTDGARKMSKSAGNTIPIFSEPDEIRKIVMNMVTDPLRIKRTDPGRPEVCNVCQLHRFFGSDYLQIQDGERTARTGCVDTKALLADRIIEFFRPMREKRVELAADADVVERVLAAGAAKVRPILEATLAEVREAVGIGPRRSQDR